MYGFTDYCRGHREDEYGGPIEGSKWIRYDTPRRCAVRCDTFTNGTSGGPLAQSAVLAAFNLKSVITV